MFIIWFAWIVTGTIFMLWLKTQARRFNGRTRFYVTILLSLATLQVLAGIATLILRVPVMPGVLHQLVALVLFGWAIATLFHFK